MQFSKESKQYILQCQLIALDDDRRESKDSLEPVIVKSKKEAQVHLNQGRTVILNGLVMSMMKGQTYLIKPETISQNLRLSSGDVERVNGAMRLIQRYIDHGSLDRMVKLLQIDAEKSFCDFKEAVGLISNTNDTHYLIAKDLKEIEARTNKYPLIPAKQAAIFLGEVNITNPSRLVAKLKKELKIIGFYFGNSRKIQIPAFQFDMINLGVYKPVEKLCHILDELNDWGVYKWLTTHDEDLECTPAQAISRPELEEDLLYLAGVFKSESTLRGLNVTSAKNDGQ